MKSPVIVMIILTCKTKSLVEYLIYIVGDVTFKGHDKFQVTDRIECDLFSVMQMTSHKN